MADAKWDRMMEILGEAVELPPEQRAAFLDRACGDDAEQRREVEALLAREEHTMALPNPQQMIRVIDSNLGSDDMGHVIGNYRIIRPVGEGGMGVVYEAEQLSPINRRVALKIIKLGMDTQQVIARFEAERQALAMMNHPNIAKIFDAGATADGRPYFVMEHVKGERITAYCDCQRLTVRQRLELFAQVCDALHHAHMKGIIHRDLKPSNILVAPAEVGSTPRPVIIDFGIAKAIAQHLTDRSIFTEQGQLIGTPEYMSPEQAEMSDTDIDTRTDVYALGMILYELLTGALPFDRDTLRAAGQAAIQKMIREVEPPRPSTRLSSMGDAGAEAAEARHIRPDELVRILRSELEWIPLKALRKDRAERYRSAAELGDDVANYLAHRPLIAGPVSTAYQLRKLLRRHQGAAAAAAAVLLALLLGLAGTLWQAARAEDRAGAAIVAERGARVAEAEQRRLAQSESAARNDADNNRLLADRQTAEANRARKAAEFEAYAANLVAADASFSANEPARVRVRLDACPESFRGWEWRWLNARSDSSLLVLRGHDDSVVPFPAFSPDGTRIVTASTDKTARVWSAASGKELACFRGHEAWLNSAVFSPAGTCIVTASGDKTARVWDAGTGKELACLRGHVGQVHSAVFSPDGARIVTASWDKTARVWDAGSGKELDILRGHVDSVTSAAFSPDGRRIVTASGDKTARVWDAGSGKELDILRGHVDSVTSAAFSPDGRRIVTASGDKTAREWDAGSGKELAVLCGHVDKVHSAAFSPDGTRIVAAGDKTVRVWDADSGKVLVIIGGHEGGVVSAMFSPDGTRIVTASWDKTARVWDAASGKELALLLGHANVVNSAVFSPDGARILTASWDKTARVWDVDDARRSALLRGHDDSVNSAAFSPDGTRIVTASGDKTARVWHAASGKELAVLRGHGSWVHSAAFSPDGRRIVTVSRDSTARVWDAGSGKELALFRGHEGTVTFAAFSPGGSSVVTASTDKTARVWNAASGKELAVLRGHGSWVHSAAFSPDGTRIVTASKDSTARVWDVASGKELATLRGHENWAFSALFSPDGARIVTAGDKTARLWDAASGKELGQLHGHEDAVYSAAFSPDGTRVVTASWDKTARIWDVARGKELALLYGHSYVVHSAAFSPDGTRIVTASFDKTARVWDSLTYRERFPVIAQARVAEAKMVPMVRALLATGQSANALREKIAGDATFTSEERAAAQAELCATLEREQRADLDRRQQASALNDAVWKSVSFLPVTADAARDAVAKARHAVELAPGDGLCLTTLGIALFRAGEYKEALDTLTRSAAINAKLMSGDQPDDWAFIAMTYWKLNQPDQACAALAKLRALAAMDQWKTDDETTRWLKEAEGLIPPR